MFEDSSRMSPAPGKSALPRRQGLLAALFVAGCFSWVSFSASSSRETQEHRAPDRPLTVPLDVRVPTPPWAFRADGKWHLVYELYIDNAGNENCALTGIEVIGDRSTPKPLAEVSGAALDEIVVHPYADPSPRPTLLPPAGFAVAYMWVTVAERQEIPATLSHRLSMKIGNYPETWSVDIQPVAVRRDPVPVLGPPLRGANWGVSGGPSNSSGHRRGLLPVNGHAYIAERFGIDWLRIGPDGQTHTGDPSLNKNYGAYGAEVLAVADGAVTEVKDGIPEDTPGTGSMPVPRAVDTLAGNHVILKIGDRLFALYAHLQTNSIRVNVGEVVHRGQVLGLVGDSGSSDEPHLHFHVCNNNSAFACEGVPYAFTSFLQQSYSSTGTPEDSRRDVLHEMELPTDQTLVRFPDR
jgi:murein DD-endopeptidase